MECGSLQRKDRSFLSFTAAPRVQCAHHFPGPVKLDQSHAREAAITGWVGVFFVSSNYELFIDWK